MNQKQVSKLQTAVIRESRSTLIGAVKQYCALFNNASELKSLVSELNKNGANITIDVVKSITTLAKDKNEVVKICCQMLPKIDDTFIRFAVSEKVYTDNGTQTVDVKDETKLDIVLGSTYKEFGFVSPIEINKDKGYYIVSQNETSKTTRVAVRLTSYNVMLVAKCVTAYLSHESKEA